ncbi:PEP-CTERM protein-sorting domain-containing protein [Candidatus Electrothrix aarhusensis]|uniref:PEP-CTERM protein-sorting domain-containing protein n=1 Tax=Candidatus Electrothrix aarhusensis TaxID=1859131 RepID=A0A444IXJ1_9BACT|nr:PEP-CTERM protein-sorting domain-containing protein [Candidatus Electrothrix aarhusensis]
MKNLTKKAVLPLLAASFILGSSQNASAFLVEQYDNFWSQDVNQLINYANNNEASSSAEWDIIDFTDDPGGFAGAIPGSNPWPSAGEAGALGTGHSLNQTFFAKITGDFYIDEQDTYTFQTYNDDGVFLFIDDILTINDRTMHPEQRYSGVQALDVGVHSVELYFFENGGEASLEFTIADSSNVFTHFDNPDYQVTNSVPEAGSMFLLGSGIAGLFGAARRKKKKA